MAVRNILRRSSQLGYATATASPIRTDPTLGTVFVNGVGSGTTEIEQADVSSVQTLTNKTLTSPTLTAPAISGAGHGVGTD
jgi:hypothetical protein